MGGNGFCRKSRISLGKRQGEREKRGTPKHLQGQKAIVGKIGHHFWRTCLPTQFIYLDEAGGAER